MFDDVDRVPKKPNAGALFFVAKNVHFVTPISIIYFFKRIRAHRFSRNLITFCSRSALGFLLLWLPLGVLTDRSSTLLCSVIRQHWLILDEPDDLAL